ncbi:MAG: chemotaxis protein CheW [Sulfuricella denitrificans]|nr:chemotaxis protein CheW [Sulfuricella denitrificans]
MTQPDSSETRNGLTNGCLDAEAVCQVLVIQTQHLLCCIPLSFVERALPLVALHPLPGGPSYLAGFMSMGGASVPVLDLGIRLGLPDAEAYTLDTPIVVCSEGERRMGLLVSSILGIQAVAQQDIQLRPAFEQSAPPFLATLNVTQGLALLLDVSRVIAIDFSLADQENADMALWGPEIERALA